MPLSYLARTNTNQNSRLDLCFVSCSYTISIAEKGKGARHGRQTTSRARVAADSHGSFPCGGSFSLNNDLAVCM